jgi:hypothetical protein
VKDIPANSEIFVSYGREYWQVIRHNIRLDERARKKLLNGHATKLNGNSTKVNGTATKVNGKASKATVNGKKVNGKKVNGKKVNGKATKRSVKGKRAAVTSF